MYKYRRWALNGFNNNIKAILVLDIHLSAMGGINLATVLILYGWYWLRG